MQALVSEPERLHDKLAFTRGYVSAVAASEPKADSAPLARIRVLLGELEALCRHMMPKIKEKTREAALSPDKAAAKRRFISTVVVVEHLQPLVNFRRDFPQISPYWPESTQRVLEETLDLFEEAQETLALGLSSEFQNEIEQARREAGIDGGDLSTR